MQKICMVKIIDLINYLKIYSLLIFVSFKNMFYNDYILINLFGISLSFYFSIFYEFLLVTYIDCSFKNLCINESLSYSKLFEGIS